MHLGDFDVAVRQENPDPAAEPDTFTVNGERFTVSGRDLTIPFGKFARAAMSGLDTAELESAAAVIDMLAAVVPDDEGDRLVRACFGADLDELMRLIGRIVQARTGRPTQQPSASPDGQSATGESSKASSSPAESSGSAEPTAVVLEKPATVSPILRDPRLQGLVDIDQAGQRLPA